MKLGFLLVAGIFFNIFLASIFPAQLLDSTTANYLLGDDTLGYDFSDSDYLGSNYKASIADYRNNTKSDDIQDLTAAGESTSILGTLGSFFDGLGDALKKIKTLFVFIIPFSTILFALPGALGLMLGTLYSGMMIFAIIRFIRGA